MAPVFSRPRISSNKKADEISKLLEDRRKLILEIKERIEAKKARRDVLTNDRLNSHRVFVERLDYLLRNGEIHHLLGVSLETFQKLTIICKQGDSTISNTVRVAVFLKFCKEGLSQNNLARYVGLSQASVSRIVVGCIKDLVSVADEYIVFPDTKDEIMEMRHRFASGKEFGVPCYAVLDGKHWACDHPPHSGSLNFNYKAFYSFNSLFLSDSDSRILYIQISKLGINSDAQLFRDGPLGQILASAAQKAGVTTLPGSTVPMPAFILSDNGFGLSKQVMTPYRENQLTGTRDLRFNEIISATRVKVENLFGILTSKFQVFGRNLRLDPENSRALIVACSVIHNISVGPLVVSQPYYQTNSALADPYTTAEQMRTALKEYLLNL